ncbi:MAG: hypothetical protein EHM12_06310, partial [Dehalococcoidia bacterium]
GKTLSVSVLKKALADETNELVLLDSKAFTYLGSYDTATVLAEAIEKIENYDLIPVGMQAADINAGNIGAGIAEMPDIPCIISVRKINVESRVITAENILSDGYCPGQTLLSILVTALLKNYFIPQHKSVVEVMT